MTPRVEEESVRPTRSQVREALFNSIGTAIRGATVLDMFGGTGALSWEALSRGARRAWIVERDRKIAGLIRDNAAALDLNASTHLIVRDALKLDMSIFGGASFDFVFADPPWILWEEEDSRAQIFKIFQRLDDAGRLPENATIFCETDHPVEVASSVSNRFETVAQRRMGRTWVLQLAKTRLAL